MNFSLISLNLVYYFFLVSTGTWSHSSTSVNGRESYLWCTNIISVGMNSKSIYCILESCWTGGECFLVNWIHTIYNSQCFEVSCGMVEKGYRGIISKQVALCPNFFVAVYEQPFQNCLDKMLKPTQHTCQCYGIRTFLWNFVARSYYTDISLHSTKIIEGVVTDDLALWFTRYIPSRTHQKEVLFEKLRNVLCLHVDLTK